MKYFKHESAYIDENVEIGEGTKIWHFSHIQKGARIGKNCVLGQNVNVGNNVIIGNNCKIQNNVSVYEGVILEDYVFCGPSMVCTKVKTLPVGVSRNLRGLSTNPRKVGPTIGANATAVCGVTIGEWAFCSSWRYGDKKRTPLHFLGRAVGPVDVDSHSWASAPVPARGALHPRLLVCGEVGAAAQHSPGALESRPNPPVGKRAVESRRP